MTYLDPYSAACDREIAAVRKAKPTTAAEVVSILREHDPQTDFIDGDAFWSPAGFGGDPLLPLLTAAGWAVQMREADYHWRARHPDSGDTIEYVEGDVYANPAA